MTRPSDLRPGSSCLTVHADGTMSTYAPLSESIDGEAKAALAVRVLAFALAQPDASLFTVATRAYVASLGINPSSLDSGASPASPTGASQHG